MVRSRITIDPYVVMLLIVVGIASLLPCRGQGAVIFGWITDAAIVFLFFLHGAKLSTEEVRAGAGHWRLHLIVLAATFGIFPLLGLAAASSATALGAAALAPGLLYLTLLPSTVQSSIAFTAVAGGNVAAAVCSASLSNLLGIFLTPLLVALLMNNGGAGVAVSGDAMQSIVWQLLVPFLAGHFSRPFTATLVKRWKPVLGYVDRGSILLVVYTAFSAAVIEGIWQQVGLADLGILFAASALILAIVMLGTRIAARRLGFAREDEIVILFCGSKKSLASGVPMAGALFPAASVGLMILPLMLFHQLQLIVCAIVAGSYRRKMEAGAIPQQEAPVTVGSR